MGDVTAISWADHTFNPWEGCTRVSPACENCYAADRAHRFGNDQLWAGQLRRTSAPNWRKPLRWDAEAKAEGVRRRVFCASLADVFDNQAPVEWRDDLWQLIEATPHLVWMLLTKRPQNVAKMILPGWRPLAGMSDGIRSGLIHQGPRNIELGVTVENAAERDRRLPIALRLGHLLGWRVFASCEPLLELVDLRAVAIGDARFHVKGRLDALTGNVRELPMGERADGQAIVGMEEYAPLSLVIAGGESGRDARPSHPDWFRRLRDDCAGAGVPFHFKQWGEWEPTHSLTRLGAGYRHADDGSGVAWRQVGAGHAGRLLDGVEHLALPEVA